jgi:type II secretory pathway pseudopilin PulG
MSQLIALIIAIALGAIVTAIGYVFLGGAFADQSVKAEAQKILVQAEQIEAAMIAYKVDHGGQIDLGDSDPDNNGCFDEATCSDNDIFGPLITEGYLKGNINSTLEASTLSWHYNDPATGGDGFVQRVVPEADQCLEANHQRNRLPEAGLVGGETLSGGFKAVAGEISEGVPICASDTARGIACCVVVI